MIQKSYLQICETIYESMLEWSALPISCLICLLYLSLCRELSCMLFECTKLPMDRPSARGSQPRLYICLIFWLYTLPGKILNACRPDSRTAGKTCTYVHSPMFWKVCLHICVQETILHAFQCTKLLVDTSPAHGGRPCLYICFVNWLHVLSGSILKCNCMSQKTHDSLHSQPPEKYKHAGVSGGHEMPLHTKTGL